MDPLVRLRHQAGVYALGDPSDVPIARRAINLRLVVGRFDATDSPLMAAIDKAGVALVDREPQRMLYAAMCPSGPTSCAPLAPAAFEELRREIRDHVAQAWRDPQVAAFYLVDDYWISMRQELSQIAADIRRIAPEAPLMCALNTELVTSTRNGGQFSSRAIDSSLQNFSRAWCTAVLVYAYSPSSAVPISGMVDWSMQATMPPTLAAMRSAGWDPKRIPLIGTPQAFNVAPRTGTRARGPMAPQYRSITTSETLRVQTTAFCAYGASSIIGYAWDDGSQGTVQMLATAPALRAGFNAGIDNCRHMWAVNAP